MWIMMGLSSVFLSTRLYCKYLRHRRLHFNDAVPASSCATTRRASSDSILFMDTLKVQRDMNMRGTSFAKPLGCWTKLTSIQDINLDDIHSHIFMLSPDNRLVAYGYREGPPNDMTGTDPAFFQELIEYLQKKRFSKRPQAPGPLRRAVEAEVEIILKGVNDNIYNATRNSKAIYEIASSNKELRIIGKRVDQVTSMSLASLIPYDILSVASQRIAGWQA